MKRLSCIIITALLVLMGISGCAGTRAAYKAAEGIEDTAFVMTKHWEYLLVEADRLAESGILSGSAKAVAQDIAREGTPFILSLKEARDAYVGVASASNEAELQAALNRAVIFIAKMTRILQRQSDSAWIPDKDLNWSLEGIVLVASAS